MGKKACWSIIILTIIVNVVMVQWTVEAHYGREYGDILIYSGVSIVSAFIALLTYMQWRKLEYKE
ncbi:hypothetical protein H1D32_23630 [Anaerobacillus sp. CMMVII]|uniref:hypothetical protein n=1 Tax=Anaerobacillus sp. CMMVII TaxID=2755588 RepID=UPI0021B836A1|nr:hypothetical protein [Anaerobacillus sp. CMMVII]MCT8140422.1 hypothetical protein [Anaerobacillus sp. CMMVII]